MRSSEEIADEALRRVALLEEHDKCSMFDSADVGGYVIVGIIGFSLGTAMTLLCVRWKNREK